MRIHDGLGSRHPRSRLRKRNTIRGFRKYYNFATGNNDAICDKDRVWIQGILWVKDGMSR